MSQTFDYANTDVQKHSNFFRLLYPLLTSSREREAVGGAARQWHGRQRLRHDARPAL